MELRTPRLALAAAAIGTLAAAPAALAATAPTVKLEAASAVGGAGATLSATVDPDGTATSYHFAYGPTPALGATSPTKSAGAGTKAVAESFAVSGLQSGTTYYYDVEASNAGGAVTSRTGTFKTTGPPPAQAQTGGAQVLSASSVNLTGVVTSEGAPTSYYFEIGTAAGTYELDTPTATVAASASPTAVTQTVTGLEPGTIFHYALVATHGGVNTGAGTDESFETFPDPVPVPKVTQRTSPRVETGGPFIFRTSGEVENKTATPDALACTGTATVSFYYGRHLVERALAPLTPSCTFASTATFKHLPIKHHKREQLLVRVRFNGNDYLAPRSLGAEKVTLG